MNSSGHMTPKEITLLADSPVSITIYNIAGIGVRHTLSIDVATYYADLYNMFFVEQNLVPKTSIHAAHFESIDQDVVLYLPEHITHTRSIPVGIYRPPF
jgi:hypothetical protein